MVKTVGGDSYISAFVDEMSKGVVGGMEQTAGGKKMLKLKGKHGGSIELAPLLVSLMTLGMRVASDPKLSETYKKHTKMSGGADILANEYDANMTISGGSASGIYDMFANALNTASIVGGRHPQKTRKAARGGNKAEPVGFDNCRYDVYEQPPVVPTTTTAKGGKSRKQSKRNMKIYGGEGEEMPEVEVPADDIISDDVMQSDDVEIDHPEEIPADVDSTDFPVDDTTTGGGRKYSRKAVKKSVKKTRGGEGTSISEMFSDMEQTAGRRKSKKALRGGECNQAVEAPAAPAPAAAAPVETQTAGRRKVKKAVRGGDGDVEEMFSPINAQTAGRRKSTKAVRGGSSCNKIWSNLPTLDISAGGGRKYKGRKIGGNLEAESLMPTSFKN